MVSLRFSQEVQLKTTPCHSNSLNSKTWQHTFHPTTHCQWLIKHRKDKTQTQATPSTDLLRQLHDFASQQRPQTSSALFRPTARKTLIFYGKNQKFELFEDLFQTMLETQLEMSKVMKNHHFHAHLREEALQAIRIINASHKRTLGDVLIKF